MAEPDANGWTKLVMTIDGQRHVFAARVPAGKDPMELTLGEWMAAPAASGVALFDDFLSRRTLPAPPSGDAT